MTLYIALKHCIVCSFNNKLSIHKGMIYSFYCNLIIKKYIISKTTI